MSNFATDNILENKEQEENKDIISELPDDILVSILSLVETKDATTTSILSKRWRYLATYFTIMEFNFSKTMIEEYKRQHRSIDDEKQSFVNWVNQVLALHRAPFIYHFRISLPLDATYSNHIDNWIRFAISKRVNKLELNVNKGKYCYQYHHDFYSLSSNVFKHEKGIRYLTSICFKYVYITPDVLELLLFQCQFLERLHIKYAHKLTNAMILSETLKYLVIKHCPDLKKVELHAVNLQSFKLHAYIGNINVVYASVPSLVEAHFRWHYGGLICYKTWLPSILKAPTAMQLSKLSLDVNMIFDEDIAVPSFPNVKYLELRAFVRNHINLLPLLHFAEACPLLHELKLLVMWGFCCRLMTSDSESDSVNGSHVESESDSDLEEELDSDSDSDNGSHLEAESDFDWERELELELDLDSLNNSGKCSLDYVKHWLETQKGTNATLPNLRKLEWPGPFSDAVHHDLELSLVLYCIKNATILEKFICDPRFMAYKNVPYEAETVEAGRRHARRLAMVIPSHIEFVIL